MNDISRSGVKVILQSLDEATLYSLAATVTQGLLRNKIESPQGAIHAIIKYSPDVSTILRRKSVTREILFNYLHKENINTSGLTKGELINKILRYWQLPISVPTTEQVGEQDEESETGEQGSSTLQPIKDNIYILAEQFTKWFFSNVNSNQSLEHHFYDDARFELNMRSSEQTNSEVVEKDPVEISQRILATKKQHNLYFNPNLSREGVFGKMDVHGLVVILSCGTLHVEKLCVGVFEQKFAIARDPFSENNWKIRHSVLNLMSKSGVFSPPKLTDGDFKSQLTLTS